jgi:hypothetical protein
MRDRAAGTARAELHDTVPGRVGEVLGEAARESGRVGVVAAGGAIVEHDRVDGAEDPGLVGQLVEVPDHLLLEGVREVQAPVPQRASPVEQVGQVAGRQAPFARVDDRVAQPDPLSVGFRLVEKGCV